MKNQMCNNNQEFAKEFVQSKTMDFSQLEADLKAKNKEKQNNKAGKKSN